MASGASTNTSAANAATMAKVAAALHMTPAELQQLQAASGSGVDPFNLTTSGASVYAATPAGSELVTGEDVGNGLRVDVVHPNGTRVTHVGPAAGSGWLAVITDAQGHETYKMVGRSAAYKVGAPPPSGVPGDEVPYATGVDQPTKSRPTAPGLVSTDVETELKSLYKLPPDQLAQYKVELWMAGYYGKVPISQVDLHTMDNDSFQAFADVMLQASRYAATGQKVSWQDVLTKMATGKPAPDKQPTQIQLTDSATLTQDAMDAAQKVIGRNPTPDEYKTFIAGVHSSEEKSQQVLAQPGGEDESVDPAARAAQFFRQRFPSEAHAVEYADKAQQFEQMLQASSQVPSTVQVQ